MPVTAVGPGTTVIHASGVNVPDVTTTVTVVNGQVMMTPWEPAGPGVTAPATGGKGAASVTAPLVVGRRRDVSGLPSQTENAG